MILVGHRGFGQNKNTKSNQPQIPENTLKSFDAAFRNGFKWIELDVQLTKDNHLIVFHDDEISYKNVFGHKIETKRICDITKAQVQRILSNGRIYRLSNGHRQIRWTTAPKACLTLNQFLRSRVASRFDGINIELKVPDNAPPDTYIQQATATLLTTLQKYNHVHTSLVLSSFSKDAVIHIARSIETAKVLLLTDIDLDTSAIKSLRAHGISGIVANVNLFDNKTKLSNKSTLQYIRKTAFDLWCYDGINEAASHCIVDP